MSFAARLKTPLYKNTGSVARDQLALERTFLAWLRTGLGFLALGTAVERFSKLDIGAAIESIKASDSSTATPSQQQQQQQQHHPQDSKHGGTKHEGEHLLVSTLIGSGAGSIAYGSVRYYSTLRLLEKGLFKPAYWGAAGVSVALGSIAAASVWGSKR